MPTYHYRCSSCGKETEKHMPFGSTDVPLCETCKTPMMKYIVPPTIHFKGSGFYKNDAAKKTDVTSTPKPTDEKKPAAPATPTTPSPPPTT